MWLKKKKCVCVFAVYVCKLADTEKPLFLRLVAGPDLDTLSFVLREQQTGEVMVTPLIIILTFFFLSDFICKILLMSWCLVKPLLSLFC